MLEKKFDQVKHLINEGDVLLFRGEGFISNAIGAVGESTYTHVGVASWVNGKANTQEGILECVEFREGKGGRSVNLRRYMDTHSGQIDVFRPIPGFTSVKWNDEKESAELVTARFDAKAVTRVMRKMTGLPYGWKRIWWIFLHKLWVWKLFGEKKSLMNDEVKELIYPVCSTAVAYSFNINGFDLLSNKADEWTEPADIAKSPRIWYLFTLTK